MIITRRRIGELLQERGLLSEQSLAHALAQQETLGDTLGEILASEGLSTPRAVYEALAEQQALPFADLLACPPEASLMLRGNAKDYVRRRCVPWKEEGGVMWFACCQPSAEVQAYAHSLAGEGYTIAFAITSPRDILRAVEQACGTVLDQRARELLLHATPHYSLRAVCEQQHWVQVALVLVAAYLALCFLWPVFFLSLGVMLCNVFYLMTMLFKPVLFLAARHAPALPTAEMLSNLPPDRDLPIYTILVPLYREEKGIPRLIHALMALDYPKSRLDIKLIVEADDTKTIQAIRCAQPPAMFEVLSVPYSLPRTKPKACNYALAFARGEFVTIYDAEDLPQPDQLKKAVAVFRAVPEEVVCLQARLNYYNRSENLLTRLFAIEYGGLFDFMLPGLHRLGVPIPLGGTSNHLRLALLRELGKWDPYNVTEDADLGIRLATENFRTLMLDSLTEEEAPVLLGTWLKQRSRWIKGYMQTWQVAMRRAPVLLERFGMAGFVGFQLFVGAASLIYLVSPFLWILSALWVTQAIGAGQVLPAWVLTSSLIVFGLGIILQWVLAVLVVQRSGWRGMLLAVALYPFYWLLHSFASFRALRQIFTAPYHWDKTPHGLSRMIPA